MRDITDEATPARSKVAFDCMTDEELIREWEMFGRVSMSDLHAKLNRHIKLTEEESAALSHNMRVGNEFKRRFARSVSFGVAWKRHLVSIALEFMDVPVRRRELSPENLRWLMRNLGIRNSDNRHFENTIREIKFLLTEESRISTQPSVD